MFKKLILLCLSSWLINQVLAIGGFYTGIGAGYSTFNNVAQSGYVFNNGSSSPQNVGSLASTLYFGYDFNQFIGLQFDYNVAYAGQIADSYNLHQQLLNSSILLHLPFGVFSNKLNNFDIYAKGGAAYSNLWFRNVEPNCDNCVNPPNNVKGFIPSYGLGLEYAIPQSIGFRLEWNSYGNINANNLNTSQVSSNSDMYLFSVLYHF